MALSPSDWTCSAHIIIILAVTSLAVTLAYHTGLLKHISQIWFSAYMNFLNPRYNKAVAHYKKELFDHLLQGKKDEISLLEIGSGPGGNLHLFPDDIRVKLTVLEPNVHSEKYLKKNLEKYNHISLERYIVGKGEDMKDIESNSLELVLSTIVFCSVDDELAVLREIKRVLKPGGTFYFLEHIAGKPGTWTYTLQHVVNPVWKIFCDGCNVIRNTEEEINKTGFSKVSAKEFYAHQLNITGFLVRPHVYGYAVK